MFKRILLPVDLEQPQLTRQAIEAAIGIADPDARLRLVNVQTMLPTMFIEYGPPDYEDEVRLEAQKQIAKTTVKIDYPRKRISTIVRIGAIYDEALTEAGEWNADLIVICSNRPTLATYLLGSNAAKIVRHATCSSTGGALIALYQRSDFLDRVQLRHPRDEDLGFALGYCRHRSDVLLKRRIKGLQKKKKIQIGTVHENNVTIYDC